MLLVRATQYTRRRKIERLDELGHGKDGHVWRTNRRSALKIHEQDASYRVERNAYMRLRDFEVTNVAGFALPELVEYDDELLAIEMTVVSAPYILDFASAIFDFPPDLIEDEGHTFEDLVRYRFGEQADEILSLHDELAVRAGIFLMDPHPHNIKFK
jgi:hypothetical protein